jgi:uncharacterized protein (DUF885 family)
MRRFSRARDDSFLIALIYDPSLLNIPGVCISSTSLKIKKADLVFSQAEALALHEAIPGHHTQTMLAGENESLPHFRRFMDDRRYSEAPAR